MKQELQIELQRLSDEIGNLTDQINLLQAKKDKYLLVKSRISELLEFYQTEEPTIIDVPILLEAEVEEVEEESASVEERSDRYSYTEYMKPEFQGFKLAEIIQGYFEKHSSAVIESSIFYRLLAREDLSKEESKKLNKAISNALIHGRDSGKWYSSRQRGFYTLKKENLK